MELRQLKYFVKVAELLNFSEAAKALFITQSTLSQQIKQLENELGAVLFERSSHKVTLTEAGRAVLPDARHALASAQLCSERINDLSHLAAGTLNMGVTYSFSPILTETISAFMKMYPQVKLNVFYEPMNELMELLKERQIDFALAFRPNRAVEGVESHILFQSYLAAIVGEHHPLASRSRLSPDELAGYDMALPAKGLQARNALDEQGLQQLKLRVRIELNEVNILLKLIRESNMVTVLAEATIHNESGVRAIPLELPRGEMVGCVHTLRAAYRKHSMQEFVRLLGESLAVKERQNAWL